MSRSRIIKKLKSNELDAIVVSHENNEPKITLDDLSLLATADCKSGNLLLKLAAFLDFETMESLMQVADLASKRKSEYEVINATLRNCTEENNIWHYYISELQKIDPSIDLKYCRPGKESQYTIHLALAISDRQNDEISFLKSKYPGSPVWKNLNQPIFHEGATLRNLQRTDAFLNWCNSQIILRRINVNSTILDLTSAGVTRIPEDLLDKESLAPYWSRLSEFIAANNNIQQLPRNIHKLQSLRLINFDNNDISNIPENIDKLRKLEYMSFEHNHRIAVIPECIKEFNRLEFINFNCCSIRDLPKEMGNVSNLSVVFFGGNNIKVLPEWLCRLQNCEQGVNIDVDVDFYFNQISNISDGIKMRLGDEWTEKTLATQIVPNNPCILHQLAKHNCFSLLEDALNRSDFSLEKHDEHGNTPLYVAFKYDAFEAAEVLLKYGASRAPVSSELSTLSNKIQYKTPESNYRWYMLFSNPIENIHHVKSDKKNDLSNMG